MQCYTMPFRKTFRRKTTRRRNRRRGGSAKKKGFSLLNPEDIPPSNIRPSMIDRWTRQKEDNRQYIPGPQKQESNRRHEERRLADYQQYEDEFYRFLGKKKK